MGHLVESATAYPDLTVRENLDAARRLPGVRDPLGAVDWEIAAARHSTSKRGGERALSLGNLQRLAVARALLHEPDSLWTSRPTAWTRRAHRDPRAPHRLAESEA